MIKLPKHMLECVLCGKAVVYSSKPQDAEQEILCFPCVKTELEFERKWQEATRC